VIEEWNHTPLYSSQIWEPSLLWGKLRDEFIDIIPAIVNYNNNSLNETEVDSLNIKIENLLVKCHRLIACVVFMIARSNEDPLIYIKDAGYKVTTTDNTSEEINLIPKIVLAIVPTFFLFAFTLSIMPDIFGVAPELKPFITYFFCALIMMVLPIIITKRIKCLFMESKQYRKLFEMPLGAYFALSIFSWIIVTIMSMGYLHPNDLKNLNTWKTISFFSLIGACFGFLTAYWIDIMPKIYNSSSALLIGRLKGPLVLSLITTGIVWAGMETGGIQKGRLTFSLMGFTLSIVISLILFHKKHILEGRTSLRNSSDETVTAYNGETPLQANIIDKSENGIRAQLTDGLDLIEGTSIEFRFKDTSRKGKIVKKVGETAHISFMNP